MWVLYTRSVRTLPHPPRRPTHWLVRLRSISSGTEFQVYDTITVDQPTVDVCNCAVDSAHCLDNFLSSAMRNTDDKPQVSFGVAA